MEDINKPTGLRIRELRMQRQLTLEQLSKLTGVSVSMLSAIERGRKSPTLTILNKINSGMKISLSELFASPEREVRRVIHKREMRLLRFKKGCQLLVMLEYDPANRFEVIRQELAPHTSWDSAPHFGSNLWEHCFPVQGDLVMQVKDERHHVAEGEVFSFIPDVPHAYINETDRPLVVMLINAYQ
ncbi:helix-turn-helix domain-containing protein [Bacillota bacterium Meth-B3]